MHYVDVDLSLSTLNYYIPKMSRVQKGGNMLCLCGTNKGIHLIQIPIVTRFSRSLIPP